MFIFFFVCFFVLFYRMIEIFLVELLGRDYFIRFFVLYIYYKIFWIRGKWNYLILCVVLGYYYDYY